MSNSRLFFKLAFLPLRRSWFLLGLMLISFAQLLLALWFCGGIQKELNHTEAYASQARFVTIQMKDDASPLDPVKEALQGDDISVEEMKTETILQKMEEEEPEIVQTVRSIGNEGLQLVPKLLLARGPMSDEVIEKIKMMTEVSKVESSPVHHARLQHFYKHLGVEMKISIGLILFLILVQLMVFQRIQSRDSVEVMKNLLAWGVNRLQARVPGFLSILSLSGVSFALSILEWVSLRKWVWKENSFLGELSLDHTLSFPLLLALVTMVGILAGGVLMSFSGRSAEE